jgi:predicted nucleotidyltransferase
MATQSLELLRRLAEAGVEFVVVGGMAATFHGTTIVTDDLDVCVRFDLETCSRLLAALAGLEARERMRVERRPLATDPHELVGYRNLYLACTLGVLDLLGELTGVGGFDVINDQAIAIELDGFSIKVMSLEQLIASKRAVGRPKDLRVAVELELLRTGRR